MRFAALWFALLPHFAHGNDVVGKFTVEPTTTWNGVYSEWWDREYWVVETVSLWDSVDETWVDVLVYRRVTIQEWADTVVWSGEYEPGG